MKVSPRMQRRLQTVRAWVGVLVLALGSGCGTTDTGTDTSELTVMTYNVLCSFCNPREYDPWAERLPYFGDIFRRYDADLIGLQELTPLNDEVADILEQVPGYGAVYYAPTGDGMLPYPDALILYRTSRFNVLESGEYWLSPTPDTPLTTGFAPPQFPRLVVWARLFDREADREIFFANTHFDNNSPSQERSAPLLLGRTAPFADDLPVVVVGDFNSRPPSTAYRTLTGDLSTGVTLADTFDPDAWRMVTNKSPAPSYDTNDRIDHIFVAGDADWTVTDWVVDLSVYGAKGRYPSDHWPVVATIEY